MTTSPLLELNDGHRMPQLGFGTYGIDDPDTFVAAIDAGYRLLDTAKRYENESQVGQCVAASSVPREELFVTTKVPGDDQGYESTLASLESSLERLGLDYVDLYLIHWPLPRVDRYVDTWRAMIDLRERGLTRSIGVSNFLPEHVDRLIEETGVVPAVNQIELHPYFPQAEQRAADADRGIVTQSWSPLGRKSDLLDHPTIRTVAQKHEVDPGRVILRWHVQLGVAPIPKSATPERFRGNLDVFSFELDEDDMNRMADLDNGGRIGGDPRTHEEF
ncbi:aldo/keto reductase [Aeromicrobium camelliae]|uniref:Aldo/keto reductase n=2 Tax=Aeromicrobium TaxID=2040 RepID=A0A3N6YYK1_9ACTN|nr:aldo/keto reductase [Aeromicrobium camelliae]RQN02871.1 aldo/keto reductase [Aeromicrobium camelliae]